MLEFNLEQATQKFLEGKSLLDGGAYRQALTLYDKFESENQQFLGVPEARNLLKSSLNNRGVAKCKYALRYDDETLYKSGIKDFQKAIAMEDELSEVHNEGSFLHNNLRLAEEEVKFLQGKKRIDPNTLPWYISK